MAKEGFIGLFIVGGSWGINGMVQWRQEIRGLREGIIAGTEA